MPTYDYRCEANGQVVEVSHRMSEKMHTWGEICERLGIAPGETPADSPVTRMATGGNIIGATGLGSAASQTPACSTGGCCPGGFCGMG